MPSPIDITTLSPINTDIEALIFDHLCNITHKPTLSTLLVSRDKYPTILAELYRDVVLNSANVEQFFGPILDGGD
ncbi:hypothetical protein IAR50_001782 [Cryptococcus sp. DSM 104548]